MKTIAYLIMIILSCAACPMKSIAQESIKSAMLEEVNRLRVSGCLCGDEYMPPVRELTWNDKLEIAARRHAADMFDNENFNHVGSDGSLLSERIEAAGYSWSMLGENISYGYSDAAGAVHGWMESDGHCRNMMNPVFNEIGAAGKGNYWVMDLGASAEK